MDSILFHGKLRPRVALGKVGDRSGHFQGQSSRSRTFFRTIIPHLLYGAWLYGMWTLAAEAQQTKPPSPDPVAQRHRYQVDEQKKRLYPLNAVPLGARQRALQQSQKFDAAALTTLLFYNIGPSPISDPDDLISGTGASKAGRVSAIAVDPSNGFHWLLGAAQGGIWESMNGGGVWFPRSDASESLAIGDIAFAPGDPTIVYAGTGEGNYSGDSYGGMGLLKSTDGGTTWTLVASSPFEQLAFSRIFVRPYYPLQLVVATVSGAAGVGFGMPPGAPAPGIFYSDDGGVSWTQTLTGEATDVAVSQASINSKAGIYYQYAALGAVDGAAANGVYRTTTGGVASDDTPGWVLINGPWAQLAGPEGLGRIRLAIAPSDQNRLYVSVASELDENGNCSLLGIWMTTNAWADSPVWTQLPDPTSGVGPFPWYSQNLLVTPTNPNVLYYAGIDVLRFDCSSWTDLPDQHFDQHALAWQADLGSVVVGNDGGVASRPDAAGGTWTPSISGLSITQFYKGGVDLTASQIILGGSQDNGSETTNGSTQWTAVFGADGNSNAVGSVLPNPQLAVSTEVMASTAGIFRTQNGTSFIQADFGIDLSTVSSFFVPFVMHPSNHDIFIAGTTNLWRTTSFFSSPGSPTWTANSPTLQTAVTAMAFAPQDTTGSTYAYGTEDGQLRLTTNAGGSWTNINSAGTVPGRYVSGLAFSPADSNQLYVALSGFDEGTPDHPGHVFKTSNALATETPVVWTNVSPPVDLPQDSIAIDPTNSGSVWVGSDIGIWHSSDGGNTWQHFGPNVGMPNVAVYDLQFDNTGTLTAFTHGRGAFGSKTVNLIVPFCVIECLIRWINPEDLVTNPGEESEFTLPLENLSPTATQNLTVTLVPSSQVLPAGGRQVKSYGTLSSASGIVERSFSFTTVLGGAGGASGGAATSIEAASVSASGSQGEERVGAARAEGGRKTNPDRRCVLPSTTEKANLTFAFSDNGQSLGSITLPFVLGTLVAPLTQDFENVRLPSLPEGWFSFPRRTWVTSSRPPANVLLGDPDSRDSANEPSDEPQSTTGPVGISAFTAGGEERAASDLYSPSFRVLTENATLQFRHSFNFNPAASGALINARAVLEISIDRRPFEDILRSGGTFTQNGYNTPAAQAWSGNSGGYLITKVKLPSRAGGHKVQLRWRLLGQSTVAGGGWYVDDVAVKEYPLTPSAKMGCRRRG